MAGAPSNFRAGRYLDHNGITGGDLSHTSVNATPDQEHELQRQQRQMLVSAEAADSLLRQLDDGEPTILSVAKKEITKHGGRYVDY